MPKFPAGPDGPFSIRVATSEDLDGVRDLLRRCSLPTEGLEEQFGARYAVAVSDRTGRIVGVAGYELHGPYGLLRSAAVDPDWQGRGLGSALTRDRIRAAEEGDGVEALFGLTTTAADFFLRFGFEAADRAEAPEEIRASSEFSRVCPSSATLIRRTP